MYNLSISGKSLVSICKKNRTLRFEQYRFHHFYQYHLYSTWICTGVIWRGLSFHLMFPRIWLLKLIKRRLEEDNSVLDDVGVPADVIISLVHFCLSSSYFGYNRECYEQIHATAMSPPVPGMGNLSRNGELFFTRNGGPFYLLHHNVCHHCDKCCDSGGKHCCGGDKKLIPDNIPGKLHVLEEIRWWYSMCSPRGQSGWHADTH